MVRLILVLLAFVAFSGAARAGAVDDAEQCKSSSGNAAIQYCTKAINSGELSAGDLASTYFERGSKYQIKRDSARAIFNYSQAIKLKPFFIQALLARGVLNLTKGNLHLAGSDFSRVIRLEPNDARGFFGRGLLFVNDGNEVLALADFSEVIRLEPDNATALKFRSKLRLSKREYVLAISDLNELIRPTPDDAEAKIIAEVKPVVAEEPVETEAAPVYPEDDPQYVEYARRGKDAYEQWMPLAEKGEAQAQFIIGVIHEYGSGQPQDYIKAIEWYGRAAEQGHVEANYAAGFLCYRRKIQCDFSVRTQWFRAAAEGNHRAAQYILGRSYRNGRGVDEDFIEAHFWMSRAMLQNEGGAMSSRDKLIEEHMTPEMVSEAEERLEKSLTPDEAGMLRGVEEQARGNSAAAIEIFGRAADGGNAEAQYMLGRLYYGGKGVEKDYALAADWYRKAAERGDISAQYRLGYAYEWGRGVKEDPAEESRWYRMVAEQGNVSVHYVSAQIFMARRYSTGKGVRKDAVLAYMWYTVAGLGDARGIDKRRDEIAETMTPEQIALAESLANAWMPLQAAPQITEQTAQDEVAVNQATSSNADAATDLALSAPAQSVEQKAELRDPETGEILLTFTVRIKVGSSDQPSVILSQSGQEFVARFVAAIKDKDMAELETLEHAESLGCHNEDTKSYFDFLYTQIVNVTFAEDNELSIEQIGEDDELPFAGYGTYTYLPRPSHRLLLIHDKKTNAYGGTSHRTAQHEIVEEGDDWAYVPPCPNEKGLAQLRSFGIIE